MEARERQRKTPQIVEDGSASGLDGGGIDCHTHTGEKLTVEDLLSEGQMDADGVEAVAPHRFEYRVLIPARCSLQATCLGLETESLALGGSTPSEEDIE